MKLSIRTVGKVLIVGIVTAIVLRFLLGKFSNDLFGAYKYENDKYADDFDASYRDMHIPIMVWYDTVDKVWKDWEEELPNTTIKVKTFAVCTECAKNGTDACREDGGHYLKNIHFYTRQEIKNKDKLGLTTDEYGTCVDKLIDISYENIKVYESLDYIKLDTNCNDEDVQLYKQFGGTGSGVYDCKDRIVVYRINELFEGKTDVTGRYTLKFNVADHLGIENTKTIIVLVDCPIGGGY